MVVNLNWVRLFGSTVNESSNGINYRGTSIYTTGYTNGSFPGYTNPTSGTSDIWLAKHNLSGTQTWLKQFGTNQNDYANDVVSDASNNLYVGGNTYGGLSGNTNAGNADAWVGKFDANGTQQWIRQFGSNAFDYAIDIAIDSNNNLYSTGYTFGSLPGYTNLGSFDGWLVKYNTSGTRLWLKQFGTTGADLSYGLTTDSSGNIYATGYTAGGLSGNANLGNNDAWLARYDTNGNQVWVKQFGSSGNDVSYNIIGDSSGNFYVTGVTLGTLPGNTSAGGQDGWIAKYNASGTQLWLKQFGTANEDTSFGITTDSSGNIYLAGYTKGALAGNTSAGGYDATIIKYNASGTLLWTRQIGTNLDDFANAITAGTDGNLYITGYTNGNLQGQTNANVGNQDAWIAQTSQNLQLSIINNVILTEGNSGTTNANFIVTLDAASSQLITVNYNLLNGTATSPSDYISQSSILTFNAWETIKTITVLVNGDNVVESDESFSVKLSNPTNAIIKADTGTGLIINNDTTELSVRDVTVSEGDSGTQNANFVVTLTNPSAATITVNYSTSPESASAGVDYTTIALSTLTFNPLETIKTISVAVLGDNIVEPDERFYLNITNATPKTAIVKNQGIGTILNNDVANVSISDVTVTEGNSGTTATNFVVTLSKPSSQAIFLNYSTSSGSATGGVDYQTITSTLNFDPGQTIKTISINVFGENLVETDETFAVNLTSASGATIVKGTGTGTILNNDTAALSVRDVTVSESDSGTQNANFVVTLTNPSATTITVNYFTSPESASADVDYTTIALSTLTFNPLETIKTISAIVLDDNIVEPEERFYLNLTNATAGTAIVKNQGIGTILNNDVPNVSITDVTVTEGNLDTTPTNFVVTLSEPSSQAIFLNYSTSSGSATEGVDYQTITSTLNFEPGQTIKTISINVLGENLVETDETFAVNLTSASGATIVKGTGTGTILNDDTTSVSLADVTVIEGNSGTTNANFVITLSQPSSQNITFDYNTISGSATADVDYVSISGGILTFNATETIKTIAIPVQGDTLTEANERFFLQLTNSSEPSLVDSFAVATIINDDTQPSISVTDSTVIEGNLGNTSLGFVVSLNAASTKSVSVNYNTLNYSAAASNDYYAISSTLSFAPGETSQTILVQVIGDTTSETNEQLLLNLSSPDGGTISDSLGVGTILNDDNLPLPKINITDSTVTEGNSGTTNATFLVSLSSPSNTEVIVNYNTLNYSAASGTDYNLIPTTTLTFLPGETDKTLSVEVIGDTISEQNERFLLSLTNPSNATINQQTAIGNILTDDNLPTAPTISIIDTSVTEGDAATTNANFTVSLSSSSANNVSVRYVTGSNSANTTDYQAISTSWLTFNPGETLKTISIPVKGDTVNESDERFFVNLSNPIGGSLLDRLGVGTILNDDNTPQISITDTTVIEGDISKTNANFVVSLSESSNKSVTINYRTISNTATVGTDFDGIPITTLTFNAGETTKTISVGIKGDTAFEPNERFFVSLSTPVNGTIIDNLGVGTITNDDILPTISIDDLTINETASGTTTANFMVSLSQSTSNVLTVDYITSNGTALAGSDYTATNGVLTFAPGQIQQSISVDITGDTQIEGNERFLVNLTNPVAGTLGNSVGVGNILDYIPQGSTFLGNSDQLLAILPNLTSL